MDVRSLIYISNIMAKRKNPHAIYLKQLNADLTTEMKMLIAGNKILM